MVLSLLGTLDSLLKRRFPEVVFSRQWAVAYVTDIGDVARVEVSFSVHGAGIKPYQEVFVISGGGYQ